MPTTIKLKNSVTTTNAPSSLAQGEVAINVTDKKVWVGNAATSPVLLLGSGADGTFTNLTVSGVASFADGTVSLPSITNIGDTNTGIFFPAADTIAFTEGGVESMRIDSAGNVGIGTSSPVNNGGYGGLTLNGTSGSIYSMMYNGTENLRLFAGNNEGSIQYASSGVLTFVDGVSGGTERMRIDSSGNVGIGTSSPTFFAGSGLEVSRAGGTASIQATRSDASIAGSIAIQAGSGQNNLNSAGAKPLVLLTDSTERMRIDSSGNVGIGMTPTNFGNGYTVLQVANASNGGMLYLTNTSNAGGRIYGNGAGLTYDAFSTTIHAFNTNGSERMRLDSAGNLLIGQTARGVVNSNSFNLDISSATLYCNHGSGTASGTPYVQFGLTTSTIGSITQNGTTAVLYNTTSDARLKTNIVDCPTGNIDDVKVRSFDWKSDGSHVKYGFVAQELVEVAPYAVHQPQDSEEMMAVDYSKLVPMMIKEIQDLKQRIKILENK